MNLSTVTLSLSKTFLKALRQAQYDKYDTIIQQQFSSIYFNV
jgi:hypothetical protein